MPKLRIRSSTLRDIRTQAQSGKVNLVPAESSTPLSPQSHAPDIAPGAIYGGHFAQVRNVIQIPFDDSIDSTHFLECFFQMPTNTVKVSRAKVWVQRKPFRRYVASVGETSTGGSTHQHTLGGSGGLTTGGGGDPSHTHPYNVPTVTSVDSGSNNHSHSVSLTTGIFESGPSGNVTLFVADDGINYGASLAGPDTSITAASITSQLTKTAGDKRLKITATGLMRVQVLLLLDLVVAVNPDDLT